MYDLLVFVYIPKNRQEYSKSEKSWWEKKYTKITKDAKNKTYLKKWNHEKSKTHRGKSEKPNDGKAKYK